MHVAKEAMDWTRVTLSPPVHISGRPTDRSTIDPQPFF
jgi:hypothetical protein